MRISSFTLSSLLDPASNRASATEAVKAAEAAYPDLAIKNSAFHRLFAAEVTAAEKGNDPVLHQSTWRIEIAHRVAVKMQATNESATRFSRRNF